MSLFDEVLGDAELEIDCPECEKSFEIQLNQVGTTVTCPHCGVGIELEKDDDFLADARSALDETEELLNGF